MTRPRLQSTDPRAEAERIAQMAAMGEIAAGLAHEVNQPLSAISLYARGSIRRLDAGTVRSAEELRETLENIAQQALRAGQIIRDARDTARISIDARVELNLNDILQSLANAWAAAGVELQLELAPDLPSLRGANAWLAQAMGQLVRNAMESALESDPASRVVQIKTQPVGADGIEVRISGPGASDAPTDLETLFQPFQTSKPGHLGLGLGIARSILHAHGGQIHAERHDDGLVFVVTFPDPSRRSSS